MSGLASSSWIDGEAVTSPGFDCSSGDFAGGVTVLMMQDRRNESHWFISCTIQAEGSEAVTRTMIYHGRLDQLITIYNQTTTDMTIASMVQLDAPASMDLLYFVSYSGISDSITSFNTETLVLTQILLPMHTPGWWDRYFITDPFTLLSIDDDGLLVQSYFNQTNRLLIYNTTSADWAIVNLALANPQFTVCSITCSKSTTGKSEDQLILACTGNSIYSYTRNLTTGSFINGRLQALIPLSLFRASICALSTGYFIRDSTRLIGICSNTLRVWNLIDDVNGTGSAVVSSVNGTLLFDSNQQNSYCGFIPWASYEGSNTVFQTFTWNTARQTLYIGCSTGIVGAISIQSIESVTPIITSIISSDICTQINAPIVMTRFIGGVSNNDIRISSNTNSPISLLLSCVEGFFLTSGRSLYSIGQLNVETYSNLLTVPESHSFYFAVSPGTPVDPSSPSFYRIRGVEIIPILNFSVCTSTSYAHNFAINTFYLICSSSGYTIETFVSVRMKNSSDSDSSDEIADITFHFSLNDSDSLSVHATRRWGVYFIGETSTYVNGVEISDVAIQHWNEGQLTPTLVSTPPSMITNTTSSTFATVVELPNHDLLVGLCYLANNIFSLSLATLWIIPTYSTFSTPRTPFDPTDWSAGYLIYSSQSTHLYTFNEVQITRDGTQAWFALGDNRLQMVRLDTSPTLNYSWSVRANTLLLQYTILTFALDDERGRVFVAWTSQVGSTINFFDYQLSIFDMYTAMFTQTLTPATSAIPLIVQIAIDPLMGSLIIIAQGLIQTIEIVIYSDQWTCAAGLQWIDGQCQPCDLAAARGFISYENATVASPQCQSCAAGRFSNVTGSIECRLCSTGRYSSSTGAIMCEYCQLNQYNNVSGLNSTCPSCPSGSQSFIAGAAVCSVCHLGQFNQPGQPCQTCPVNTYSPSLGAACLTCTDSDQEGLQCLNGLANVNEGWWAYQMNASESSSKFVTTRCPPSYCPGSQLQIPNAALCQYPRLNSSNNWLCAECVEGHIAWNSSCQPCTRVNISLLIGILIFSILLVFFLLRASSAADSVTILIFFVQIAALELGPISEWIDWIQFANFGLHSTRSCLLPIRPITQNILTMLIPMMLVLILIMIGFLHCLMSHCMHDRESSSRLRRFFYLLSRDFSVDRYIGCTMAILIFCYTSATVTCVQSLHCVSVAPDIDRLFSAPTIDCNSHEYKTQLLPVAVVLLILYVIGFPLAMFVFLWRSLPTLRQLSVGHPDQSFSSQTSKFAARWSHFYHPYRSEVWYWQPFAMLRRFAFALISVLLIESQATRYALYSSIGLFSLVLHNFFHPLVTEQWNHLESASYLLLIYISFLLSSITPPFSIGIQVTLFFLIVPFSLLLILMSARIYWVYLKSALPLTRFGELRSPSSGAIESASALIPLNHEYSRLPISSSSHGLSDEI